MVYFYEPKGKVDNRIWALKHAKKPKYCLTNTDSKEGVKRHFFFQIF